MPLIYSFMIIILVLCQLFSYDDFVKIFEAFEIPGGSVVANIICGGVVIGELLSLPFLLGMKIGHVFESISMALGLFIPIFWLFVVFWLAQQNVSVPNIGLFGSVIELGNGPASAVLIAIIGLTSALSTSQVVIEPKQK